MDREELILEMLDDLNLEDMAWSRSLVEILISAGWVKGVINKGCGSCDCHSEEDDLFR